jgi:hypothetical protein
MQLTGTVENQAVLSNVGEVSAFTIKATAKSFQILSSSLYSNKIRAIIREYSCNAVDSHVAAGKADVPFDVRLPSALEPWFAIRDYGVGLSDEEVRTVYSSFFESTKTNSNEFIGALGLGSKSAFAYTNNFTVTAIKDGRKGVYTAFINEKGVPSIALMTEQETTDPNGVEIRFSVEDNYDFGKFRNEAASVFTYFKLRPIVSGNADFKVIEPEYSDDHIIPGVHAMKHGSHYDVSSTAIMGNIAYPISVPQAEQVLGNLNGMLNCGLVMEFGIGELDIQASREGLSYIPETIAAIKNKLEALNAHLAIRLASDADKFTNLWERSIFLNKKFREKLWTAAVAKYVTDTKFPMHDTNSYGGEYHFPMTVKKLAEEFNIDIKAFQISRNTDVAKRISSHSAYNGVSGSAEQTWNFNVSSNTMFVINDTTIGAQERAKYHWKNTKQERPHNNVYVLESFDKNKPVEYMKFFEALNTPPENQIFYASKLLKRDRVASMGKNVTILQLEKRGGKSWHRGSDDMVWRDAGDLKSFDTATTWYYLPISGFTSLGKFQDMKSFGYHLKQSAIFTGTVLGVRKTDIAAVQAMPNWVNIDVFVEQELNKINTKDFMGIVKKSLDIDSLYKYNIKRINSNSPYLKLYNEFKDIQSVDQYKQTSIEFLSKAYGTSTGKVKITDLITTYSKEVEALHKRYRLINELGYNISDKEAVSEYINAIDLMKGI